MILLEQYRHAVQKGEIEDDPLQRQILIKFQEITDGLLRNKSLFKKTRPLKGLYLYGPVGAGKTYLMDLFFNAIPTQKKMRLHFHQFMQMIDARLRELQGQKNPLTLIANQLAKQTQVLCLDEFLVNDIADAMILVELLKHLFENAITLVVTSNTRPEKLYWNGLQRVRFLPAIDLILSHCDIMILADHRDYRLGRPQALQAYLTPNDKNAEAALAQQFHAWTLDNAECGLIQIQRRMIACVKFSEKAVWFKFDVICNMPRSQLDYLEIAQRFQLVCISDIPILTSEDTAKARLFINLIDILYDKKIKLIVTAAVPASSLYTEGDLVGEFQRTISRLEEMQSQDYLK